MKDNAKKNNVDENIVEENTMVQNENVTEQSTSTLDPFDPERLKLTQDFAGSMGVKKVLVSIPVKKPTKEWFVRTHPDPSYQLETGILELKEDNEMYLVDPKLWSSLSTDPTFSPRALFLAMNRQNILFIWPVRLPGADGKIDDWSKKALEAAVMANNRWIRLTANMPLGTYDVHTATGQIPDPEWPDLSFAEILKLAFKDRYIDSWDHPVLQKLRGEI